MNTVRIDIVSDIVCPWCVIGYKRLQGALTALSDTMTAELYFHPFELNPMMGQEGQNLREHLQAKYGTNNEASIAARETLTQLGREVDFQFQFSDDMRIYNTRKAHQLLMWSQHENRQTELKMALFNAYFSQGKDISQEEVLMDTAVAVGLDPINTQNVLNETSWADAVASTEKQWLEAGINAVPAIIINKKHLISGAQTTELLISALEDIVQSP